MEARVSDVQVSTESARKQLMSKVTTRTGNTANLACRLRAICADADHARLHVLTWHGYATGIRVRICSSANSGLIWHNVRLRTYPMTARPIPDDE